MCFVPVLSCLCHYGSVLQLKVRNCEPPVVLFFFEIALDICSQMNFNFICSNFVKTYWYVDGDYIKLVIL